MSTIVRNLKSFSGTLLGLLFMLIVLFWAISKASKVAYVGPAAQWAGQHAGYQG